jgi:anti-anti-sigma regulatory factor
MGIESGPFKISDLDGDCFKIKITGSLTGNEVSEIREQITNCIGMDYSIVYIDAKEVTEADLSGINEIIHSHYTLDKSSKKLIFVYKKNTAVEKWVETTGLDKFVETAIIPAS